MNVTTDEATRQMITSMASELQTTAAKAFELYITGLQVEAGLNLAASIAALVTGYISAKKAYRWSEETQFARRHDESDNMFAALVAGLVAVVFSAFIFYGLADTAVTMIIPEYTAMEQVINAAR